MRSPIAMAGRFAWRSPLDKHTMARQRPELLAELSEGAVVLADKAYDADAIRALIEAPGAAPNIPARSTRKGALGRALHAVNIDIIWHRDGRLSIRYNGVDLAYRTFDKIRHVDQGAIADNKRQLAL